jgi:uncharacterized OB-fold protein
MSPERMAASRVPATDPGLDPRPRISPGPPPAIAGTRCVECEYPSLEPVEQCPVCWSPVTETTFPPTGTVFSGTVLRIVVAERPPPLSLVYVDLDDGPRLLGHGRDRERALRPGERVVLHGVTADGDPEFALIATSASAESGA